MEWWSKVAEWFDLNREKVTLVAGGIGVVFSLLGIRLGLPFDWAWFTIIFVGCLSCGAQRLLCTKSLT